MRKTVSPKKVFGLVGAIFAGIGAIFLAVALVLFIKDRSFKADADKVVGIITEIGSYYDSEGDPWHEVWVSYQVNGETYNTKLNSYRGSMHEGGHIDLYVSKDDPYEVQDGIAVSILMLVFGILGGFFFILGIVFISILIGSNTKRKKLMENGKRLKASVTGGNEDLTVIINGRHPYRLDCVYQDEFTGESYLYSSDYLLEDPNMYIDAKVDVYVDGNDMSKYYVDLNSLSETGPLVHDFRR